MRVSRLLIKDGYVLTMDDTIGELSRGSVLIEGECIAAIAPTIEAPDAQVIDASGMVVMPGFVDTHRHTWQTQLRAICADWSLMEYFRGIRTQISPHYSPHDVYVGNYVGSLEALNAGVTTLLDFSHCINTPEHADAAVTGLRDAGIRALFCYGYFESSPASSTFSHEQRLADARRVARQYFSSDEGLLTMGVALTEVGLIPFTRTIAEIESARQLGVRLVAHTGCLWGSQSATRGIRELHERNLLGPEQVHVHCNTLDDDEWQMLAAASAKVSTAPETELQMGMGHPMIRKCLQVGIKPTLSCDVVSLNSGDMLTQMRIALQFQRCMDNDPICLSGQMPAKLDLTVRDAIRWATINGAEACGLEARVGSLAPGKQADILLVGGKSFTMRPRPEMVGSVVVQANVHDIHTVLVAGRVVKRNGTLVDVDLEQVWRMANESQEAIFERVLAHGPLLPPEPPGFEEFFKAMTDAHLAMA